MTNLPSGALNDPRAPYNQPPSPDGPTERRCNVCGCFLSAAWDLEDTGYGRDRELVASQRCCRCGQLHVRTWTREGTWI